PLDLRLMEAIGEPLQTSTLPLAFAHADLTSNAGWKTRLEAAERLSRTGAIEPNLLLGLYTEREAAASGGVWERVRAIQALDRAITASDRAAVARALPVAWQLVEAQELEVPFAALFGEALAGMDLEGAAGARAFRVGLLSDGYERVAKARTPRDGGEAFLIGLATGDGAGTGPPDQMGAAIKAAFTGTAGPTQEFAALIDERRLGEALLKAIDQVTDGARGDLRDVTEVLAFLQIGSRRDLPDRPGDRRWSGHGSARPDGRGDQGGVHRHRRTDPGIRGADRRAAAGRSAPEGDRPDHRRRPRRPQGRDRGAGLPAPCRARDDGAAGGAGTRAPGTARLTMAAPAPDREAARWISAFLEAQAAELDAARNTLLAYGRDLKDFASWLARRKLDFARATRADVEAYLVACDAEGLSRATRARRLSAIRQLYRFAYDEGWRAENPAIQIAGPARAVHLPKVLTV